MASDEVISVGTEHFKIDIEIHYLAQTMDSDAPDLEAFEYNLCAIIQARAWGLGKNATLVSNLSGLLECFRLSVGQKASYDNRRPNVEHHHIFSLI